VDTGSDTAFGGSEVSMEYLLSQYLFSFLFTDLFKKCHHVMQYYINASCLYSGVILVWYQDNAVCLYISIKKTIASICDQYYIR